MILIKKVFVFMLIGIGALQVGFAYPLEQKINMIVDSVIQSDETMANCQNQLDLLHDLLPDNELSTKLLNGGISTRSYPRMQELIQGHMRYAYQSSKAKLPMISVVKVLEKRFIFYSAGQVRETYLLFSPYLDTKIDSNICLAKLLSLKGQLVTESIDTGFFRNICLRNTGGFSHTFSAGDFKKAMCARYQEVEDSNEGD